jgi:hypothetical protein
VTVYKITNECVEKELKELLEHAPFSYGNLEKLNILCKAMWNLSKMHHAFTEEDAKEWAKHMDPPARWTMEQTTAVMNQNGYYHKPCEFWITMNMLFSDYGKTLIKNNMDKPEIWAAMAHDFLDAPDAQPDKVGRYWRAVV